MNFSISSHRGRIKKEKRKKEKEPRGERDGGERHMRAASSLRGWDENQEPLWHGAAHCDGMFDAVLDISVRGK